MDTTASRRSLQSACSPSLLYLSSFFEAFLEHSGRSKAGLMHIYKTERERDRQAGLETERKVRTRERGKETKTDDEATDS